MRFEGLELVSLQVRSYYDIQKIRISYSNRLKALERNEKIPESLSQENYHLELDHLKKAEAGLRGKIDRATREHPVRKKYLDHVSGIGPVLAGGLIATISVRSQVWARLQTGEERWVTAPELYPNEGVRDERYEGLGVESLDETRRRAGIACFDTVSKLWAFAGLAVIDGRAQRRKKGERANWSSNLKVLCWKIGESFNKVGKAYRKELDAYKEALRAAHPEPVKVKEGGRTKTLYTDGHIHNAGKRCTVKLFLSHLWEVWRTEEGLAVRPAYILEHGHTDRKDPWAYIN